MNDQPYDPATGRGGGSCLAVTILLILVLVALAPEVLAVMILLGSIPILAVAAITTWQTRRH